MWMLKSEVHDILQTSMYKNLFTTNEAETIYIRQTVKIAEKRKMGRILNVHTLNLN